MRAIITDLHTRSTAALSPDVPVLLPEQREQPAQGRLPGRAGGLSGYLAQHPQGYVQLEEPDAIRSNGLQDTYWTAVGCLASAPEVAEALAVQVRAALAGLPPLDPGLYTYRLPIRATTIAPGVYMSRATYELTLINGLLPGREV